MVLLKIFNVNMEDVMYKMMQDERISRKLLSMLSALNECRNNQKYKHDLDNAAAYS